MNKAQPPKSQLKLYALDKIFNFCKNLFEQSRLPNKILFSGQKGIGKSTLCYHISNFILSKNEEYPYNIKEKEINLNNKTYNLITNNIHPNFFLIDIKAEKKNIDVSQVREMISYTNKSSFNSKRKIVLIDNIEYMNINSVNSLLKVIEEPNEQITFFLVHNIQKNIFSTLKSRCIQLKVFLDEKQKIEVINSLTEDKFFEKINSDFKNYYISPAQYIEFYNYCKNNNIDFQNITIESFLKDLICNYEKNKDSFFKDNLIHFLEYFFAKKIKNNDFKIKIHDNYKFFTKKLYQTTKYNLDLESFVIELKSKLINE